MLSAASIARGDDIDRSQYADMPAEWQHGFSTIPVNRDDHVPDELRTKFAGQRVPGEYMVYYNADGAIAAVDTIHSIRRVR